MGFKGVYITRTCFHDENMTFVSIIKDNKFICDTSYNADEGRETCKFFRFIIYYSHFVFVVSLLLFVFFCILIFLNEYVLLIKGGEILIILIIKTVSLAYF